MTTDKNSFWENWQQGIQSAQNIPIQFATVKSVTGGRPIIRFSGESTNSSKIYKYLKSYSPAVGDRVMIIHDIIIGGWV